MTSKTGMLHVRIEDETKARAAAALDGTGLSLSDAVRILVTRIAEDGVLPPGLLLNTEAHDAWFRDKVAEALNDLSAPVSHADVMAAADRRIARGRNDGGI
ncbi:MAG: type II toxin-antitoxin system RelB/DinJ family antitoxin [Pannonibacter sp.]